MIEYLILSVYIVFISFFFQRKKILLILLTFVPLLLFFGTRVDMGVDYDGYLEQFELQHDWSFDQYLLSFLGGKFEPGFFLLVKLFPTFNSLIFGCTALLLVPVAIFFYDFIPSKYYPLAFILYLFNPSIFESFIAMRSGVVVGLFLLAVVLRNRGLKKIAFVIVAVCGTFHMSGFFLTPFFLMTDTFLKKHFKLLTIVIVLLMVSALFSSTLFGDFVGQISRSVGEVNVYEGHIKTGNVGLGFYLFNLIRVGFVIYILILIRNGIVEDRYLWIAWLTIFDYFFYMGQGIDVMYRFVYYFYIITILFKCYVLKADKSSYSRLYVGLSMAYLAYTFLTYIQLELTQRFIWNYKSFLFN